MAGASDISAILSQAGRIEKVSQNPFVHSEVARQILTQDEAKERVRRNREVNESDKAKEIAVKDRERKQQDARDKAHQGDQEQEEPDEQAPEAGKKHIIDVLI